MLSWPIGVLVALLILVALSARWLFKPRRPRRGRARRERRIDDEYERERRLENDSGFGPF